MKQKRLLKMQLSRFMLVLAAVGTLVICTAFADNYFEISKNLEIFTSIYKELNIYYVDETKPGSLMKTGIDAMLRSLDPYTVYYPESKIEDYRFMTTGQYGGIGALINSIEGKIFIAEPHEGFAAEKAGLKAGDQVVAIDGQIVEGKNQEELGEVLKGQAGTEVSLSILRPGEDEIRIFDLIREEVKIPDVPHYQMLDDKTGYIKLTGFTKTASMEVRAAFRELKDKNGMEQLVLDLRGNGGGLLREAVNIVNFFIPKGEEVVSTKGKLEEWNKIRVALSEPLDLEIPVIVLINGRSASASEIVSGALQDLDRAVIVGSRSFGKGLVQQTKDVAFNSKLKLTIAKYYIPSGRCIQKLDYTHRGVDGHVDEVADTLIKPFLSKGGRTLYDGRGIDPDVKVDFEQLSHVLKGLISSYIDFNWVTEYAQRHDSIAPADRFSLSNDEYEEFVNYALNADFEYFTETERYYQRLKEVAEEEQYILGAESEFEALYDKIRPQKETDLIKFKEQIKRHLEQEIVSRYEFQSGRITYQLASDPFVDEALRIFETSYDSILGH